MSEEKSAPQPKKLLEKSPMSGIAVPIAIVLIGALIIFGVTKMLSSGKNHRDLVSELNSKTFGNRWVAAYELSKYLASSRIPEQDVPWVVENLIQVYNQSVDARTRNFVVLALGTLKNPLSIELMNKAVNDEDPQVNFNAIVGLGNLPAGSVIEWDKLKNILHTTNDEGVKQAIIFAMAMHRRNEFVGDIRSQLGAKERMVRYAAAMGMVYFAPSESASILKEILDLPYDKFGPGELNGAQAEVLKLNLLTHVEKSNAVQFKSMLDEVVQKDSNIQVSTKAKQVLNLLKK
jgi:HEAT repeat protein